MALPGAAQCRRNSQHRALAGVGAGGADDCGRVYPLDGAGTWACVFALAVLAFDGIPGECGGGDAAGALPAPVHQSVSSGGARGRHPLAGADFPIRDGAARTLLSLLRVRDGGGRLSLGVVGDGRHGGGSGGTAVDRSVGGAGRTGTGGGPVAAGGASAAPRRERARTGSATALHEFGVSDCPRILAGLYVGEPEESAGRARRRKGTVTGYFWPK